jgi:uncharacterized RDD family membrane protein YckC
MNDHKEQVQDAQTIEKKSVDTGVADARYSGFWVRGAGHIIDGVVIGLITMVVVVPLTIVLAIVSALTSSPFLQIFGQGIGSLLGLIIGFGYYIFMTHKYQATLGKMAIGAKVQAQDGTPLSLNQIVLRETIGKLASSMTLGIGYIMVAFTQKKQGLHDIIAESVVVYTDQEKGPNKLAVGIVYGVYAFFFILFFTLLVTVLFLVGFVLHHAGDDMDTESFWEDDAYYEKYQEELLPQEMDYDTPENYLIEEL